MRPSFVPFDGPVIGVSASGIQLNGAPALATQSAASSSATPLFLRVVDRIGARLRYVSDPRGRCVLQIVCTRLRSLWLRHCSPRWKGCRRSASNARCRRLLFLTTVRQGAFSRTSRIGLGTLRLVRQCSRRDHAAPLAGDASIDTGVGLMRIAFLACLQRVRARRHQENRHQGRIQPHFGNPSLRPRGELHSQPHARDTVQPCRRASRRTSVRS